MSDERWLRIMSDEPSTSGEHAPSDCQNKNQQIGEFPF